MQTFASLLTAVYADKQGRPTASEALGAVMLDAAGLKPEEVDGGRILLWVRGDEAHCVDRALFRIFGDRMMTYGNLTSRSAVESPRPDGIVLLEDMHALNPSFWLSHVGEHGIGCVLVLVDGSAVEHDVEVFIDRRADVPAVDTWPIIPDAVRLVTNGHYIVREADLRGATVDDVRAALGPRTTATKALETIRRMVSGRRERERQKEKDAASDAKAAAMLKAAQEADAAAKGPEPLGRAAERVVRRLSEMTGFGAAGDWGMRLAADVRDYKFGEVSWSDVDKGVLLVGPPGGGKTTFAAALALECEVELVTTSYGEWHEGGGDAVARTLKKLFDKWRTKGVSEPFILLVDEIDSMGKRGANGHNEGWFVTQINNWLNFLDGPTPRPGVIVVATTNNASNVDPALFRPGRLDRVVELPYPGVEALAGVIRHHLGTDAAVDEGELRAAARACRGKSPAQIEQFCREARGICRRIYKRRVTAEDVIDVLEAQRRAKARPPALDESVAVHEAGHAVVALAVGHAIEHVDVDAGHVVMAPGRALHHRDGIEREMTITLAGKAAEEIVLGQMSTSGGSDVEGVTQSATSLHGRLGLGAAGHVAIDTGRGPVLGTPLHAVVKATTDAAWERSLRMCRIHRRNIRRLADELLKRRYMEQDEVQAMMVSPLRDLATMPVDEREPTPEWFPSPRRIGTGFRSGMAA